MANVTAQPKSVAPGKFEAEMVELDAGVESQLPAGVSLTINGVAQKQPVIDQTLQNWIDIFKAADTAKAAYENAVAARVAITAQAKAYVKALKAVIKSYFGPQSAQLQAFGIPTDKARTTSAKDSLVASAKRQQTKELHGTNVGKKQRAANTVIGNPPVSVSSTGTMEVGARPVNSPSSAAGSSAASTPASAAGTGSSPAPAASGSGNGTNGSSPAGA